MDVTVLKFELKPGIQRMGSAVIGYGELQIETDLMIYVEGAKLWIKMPEIWRGNHKERYCYWPSQEISDRFQEAVLTILQEKHGVTFDKVLELFKLRKEMKRVNKNPVHQTQE